MATLLGKKVWLKPDFWSANLRSGPGTSYGVTKRIDLKSNPNDSRYLGTVTKVVNTTDIYKSWLLLSNPPGVAGTYYIAVGNVTDNPDRGVAAEAKLKSAMAYDNLITYRIDQIRKLTANNPTEAAKVANIITPVANRLSQRQKQYDVWRKFGWLDKVINGRMPTESTSQQASAPFAQVASVIGIFIAGAVVANLTQDIINWVLGNNPDNVAKADSDLLKKYLEDYAKAKDEAARKKAQDDLQKYVDDNGQKNYDRGQENPSGLWASLSGGLTKSILIGGALFVGYWFITKNKKKG